jgi:dihydrofolate reductase
MRVSFIVAADRGGVIGRAGTLPWRLPADLRHFKETTMGKPMIMGRRTWESIGRALPGRRSIVLTRRAGFEAPGAAVVSTPDEALALAEPADEVMVIGGEAVYRALLGRCDRIYLTRVEGEVEGDTHFPQLEPAEWREVAREERPPDAANPYPLSFLVLDRA